MTKAGLAKDVKEGPIPMRPELVRATLADVKTQTRRTRGLGLINAEPGAWQFCDFNGLGNAVFTKDFITYKEIKNPFGWEGDQLWVREGWRWYGRIREPGQVEGGFEYRADGTHRKFTDFADPEEAWEQFKAAAVHGAYHWRPSIHMPRWASRLSLEIVSLRVERVQDISEEDARAEGVDYMPSMPAATTHRTSFARGWDVINGKKGLGWSVNPWLWALTYKRVTD